MEIPAARPTDEMYPAVLRKIARSPKQLYIQEKLRADMPLVVVVRSRQAVAYGKEAAKRICTDLVRSRVGIT